MENNCPISDLVQLFHFIEKQNGGFTLDHFRKIQIRIITKIYGKKLINSITSIR